MWFLYQWDTGNFLDYSEAPMVHFHKGPLHGGSLLSGRALQSRAVFINVDRLFSMEDVFVRVLCSDITSTLAFVAQSWNSHRKACTLHPDDGDANDWDFPDVPSGSYFNVHPSLRQGFDDIRGLCGFFIVARP